MTSSARFLLALALSGSFAAPLFFSSPATDDERVTPRAAAPRLASDVIGWTREQVLARAGVPVQTGSQFLDYRSPTGQDIRLTLHDRVVVHAAPADVPFDAPVPIPEEGTYPGQPVDELMARIGAPQEVSFSVDGYMTLRYADRELVLADGVVVH